MKKYKFRMIFCALFVFSFTLIRFIEDIKSWTVCIDTNSYFNVSFKDPWKSIRTPGFEIYLKGLNVQDGIKKFLSDVHTADEQNRIGKTIHEVDLLFKRVVQGNVFLLSLSVAFLTIALSQFIPAEIAAVFCSLCIALSYLPNPGDILADQPACIFTVLFIAIGLFFLKTQRLLILLLLCLCAAFAILIKPGMAFLPFIAGVIVLIKFIRFMLQDEIRKAICTFFIGCSLCIATLLWPILLYIEGGFFVSSQLSGISKMMFAIYLLHPEDEKIFSETEYKKIVADLVAQKPDVDRSLDKFFPNGREYYSKINIYRYSVNQYGWIFLWDVCRANGINSYYRLNKLAKDIADPIIKAHFTEYLKTVGRSFLSAFGAYPDYRVSMPQRYGVGQFSLYISLGCLLIILSSLFFGDKSMRWPTAFTASIHPLLVLVHSIVHAILDRYLEITEWSFLLAFFMALYALFAQLNKVIIKRRISVW